MPKKAKSPIVMVSSSVYGHEDLLDQVYATLTGFGYEVWSSHSGTMPTFSNVTAFENCVKAVQDCDLFFGIITPFYGSGIVKDEAISITHKEMLTAIELNKPRWFVAHDHVVFARQLLRALGHQTKADRKALPFTETGAIDDLRVIDMYEDATRDGVKPLAARTGNWVQTVTSDEATLRFATAQFNRIHEVQNFLTEQLSNKAGVLKAVSDKSKS